MNNLKVYLLTTLGSERTDLAIAEINKIKFLPIELEIIMSELGVDLNIFELVVHGLIKLFPKHTITEKLFINNRYQPGTLGCMLAHYKAYQKIAGNEESCALILEDNILIRDDFLKDIQNFFSKIDRFDILHLFSTKNNERNLLFDNIYEGDGEWGTAKAQLVSNQFANKAINQIPFYEVADGITMLPSLNWVNTGMSSHVMYPYPIQINQAFQSTRQLVDKTKNFYNILYRKLKNHKDCYKAGIFLESKKIEIFEHNGLCIYLKIKPFLFDNNYNFIRDINFDEFEASSLFKAFDYPEDIAEVIDGSDILIDSNFIKNLSVSSSKYIHRNLNINNNVVNLSFRVVEIIGPNFNEDFHFHHNPFFNYLKSF
jgi:GR25 family glycosyltransferase involved in LPS biosynthesis